VIMSVSQQERRERHAAYMREWRKGRPPRNTKKTHEQHVTNGLWAKHKLRLADYDALWESQGGKCYLCGDDLVRGRKTHIDHDHSCCPRNKSCALCRRGLSCDLCNWIIGYAGDDPGRLRMLADNLEAAQAVRRW
jgi:Recombination endonuclease VII